jgi:hypothetical protein
MNLAWLAAPALVMGLAANSLDLGGRALAARREVAKRLRERRDLARRSARPVRAGSKQSRTMPRDRNLPSRSTGRASAAAAGAAPSRSNPPRPRPAVTDTATAAATAPGTGAGAEPIRWTTRPAPDVAASAPPSAQDSARTWVQVAAPRPVASGLQRWPTTRTHWPKPPADAPAAGGEERWTITPMAGWPAQAFPAAAGEERGPIVPQCW